MVKFNNPNIPQFKWIKSVMFRIFPTKAIPYIWLSFICIAAFKYIASEYQWIPVMWLNIIIGLFLYNFSPKAK